MGFKVGEVRCIAVSLVACVFAYNWFSIEIYYDARTYERQTKERITRKRLAFEFNIFYSIYQLLFFARMHVRTLLIHIS
jgi:hypothetical protein